MKRAVLLTLSLALWGVALSLVPAPALAVNRAKGPVCPDYAHLR